MVYLALADDLDKGSDQGFGVASAQPAVPCWLFQSRLLGLGLVEFKFPITKTIIVFGINKLDFSGLL